MKKKYSIGDSVEFKDGRVGTVSEYDEKFYYITDQNGVECKLAKDSEEEEYVENLFGEIQNSPATLSAIAQELGEAYAKAFGGFGIDEGDEQLYAYSNFYSWTPEHLRHEMLCEPTYFHITYEGEEEEAKERITASYEKFAAKVPEILAKYDALNVKIDPIEFYKNTQSNSIRGEFKVTFRLNR